MKFIFEINNYLESRNRFLQDSRIIQFSEEEHILVIDNHRVQKLIKNGTLNRNNIFDEYKFYLDYGLIIILKNDSITLLNDIHGAYSLFSKIENDKLTISNYFNLSNDFTLNKIAVLQLIHFNHFLGRNTICNNTNRLPGGQKIYFTANKIEISEVYSWDDFLLDLKKTELRDNSFNYLSQSITESIITDKKTTLTLTGGFDSRMLFGVLLKNKINFDSITWSIEDSSQTEIAEEISSQYGIKHRIIYLTEKFELQLDDLLMEITQTGSELPFITDIPQFLYMCSKLSVNQNLISGFMGSEIIRGPSYSSEVTLTKFAAQIQLCNSREEIKNLVIQFQEENKIINDDFVFSNIDLIVDNYFPYSKCNLKGKKNENIFKYLFREKYAKIYGLIIQLHFSYHINLINPFMDFKFILKTLQYNNAFVKFNPYQNNWFTNFKLYRFYAKEIKEHYPQILNTKLDRGYKLNDLISVGGNLKLIPLQIRRKWKKKSKKNARVVDSFLWYNNKIKKIELSNSEFKSLVSTDFIKSFDNKKATNLEKIKIQLILALNLKLNDKIH